MNKDERAKEPDVTLSSYSNGIAHATGYMCQENGKRYLVVRNTDSWYVEQISAETGRKLYKLSSGGWAVKARNVHGIPSVREIENVNDFCRAFLEIHAVLDLASIRTRKGERIKRPRLRIYGNENILTFLNAVLPAKEKKLQYITNTVDKTYVGKTCGLYYQSKAEILAILRWIDGEPKNEKVWDKWESVLKYK